MRGLKHLSSVSDRIDKGVASFTDAWIETGLMRIELLGGTSHLLQMRGLKLSRNILLICICMSHLLQMRGLKHLGLDRKHHRHEVASFTDAWIETFFEVSALMFFVSHLLQMRGLKLESAQGYFGISESHLLQMRGLKLLCLLLMLRVLLSHLLQMRGLKRA